jgi:hypothetical protein
VERDKIATAVGLLVLVFEGEPKLVAHVINRLCLDVQYAGVPMFVLSCFLVLKEGITDRLVMPLLMPLLQLASSTYFRLDGNTCREQCMRRGEERWSAFRVAILTFFR